MPSITTNHAFICLYYYLQRFCNFHKQIFQIQLKCHCSKPIKLQKFLMQWYNERNKQCSRNYYLKVLVNCGAKSIPCILMKLEPPRAGNKLRTQKGQHEQISEGIAQQFLGVFHYAKISRNFGRNKNKTLRYSWKLSGKSDPPPKVVISGPSVPTKTYSSPKILSSNLTSPSLRKKSFG